MSKLQPVRGTADLLPDVMAQHRLVIDTARHVTARYGFQEMATPIFEFSEVFSRPLGESSDIVTKENYSFADRGGEQLTLRPENTAGVVRAMISGGLTQSLPLKYFYAGPMFRYERPQKGRMRQFHQVGIEYLGPNDALADAEVISAGARFLAQLDVLPHCVLHLNSLGDAESRQAYRAALVGFLQTHESALSADSKRRLAMNPLRILDSKDAGDRDILKTAPKLQDYLNAVSKAHFQTLTSALDAAGVRWMFDPLLVRGLDYYCHTAFEFVTDALGTQAQFLVVAGMMAWQKCLEGQRWRVLDGPLGLNVLPCSLVMPPWRRHRWRCCQSTQKLTLPLFNWRKNCVITGLILNFQQQARLAKS